MGALLLEIFTLHRQNGICHIHWTNVSKISNKRFMQRSPNFTFCIFHWHITLEYLYDESIFLQTLVQKSNLRCKTHYKNVCKRLHSFTWIFHWIFLRHLTNGNGIPVFFFIGRIMWHLHETAYAISIGQMSQKYPMKYPNERVQTFTKIFVMCLTTYTGFLNKC